MKLAIALSERADLQRRISEINTRLNRNAKVQEGEVPSEEPASLLQELDDCLTRLETLIVRINRTNQATIRDERSIADRIAERDCLRQRIQIMRDFLGAASDKVDRYSKTEIIIHSSLTERNRQLFRDAQEVRGNHSGTELDHRADGIKGCEYKKNFLKGGLYHPIEQVVWPGGYDLSRLRMNRYGSMSGAYTGVRTLFLQRMPSNHTKVNGIHYS